jgi:hypothetical protein
MDIGLVYSEKDPRQKQARDFLRRFVRERGVLANIFESQRDVASPTLIINGQALRDLRRRPREGQENKMFPAIPDIASALERHIWGL